MPSRIPYVGDVRPPTSYPLIPMQPETQVYLARFSGQISPTYKNALNEAIFRWKKAGVWPLLQDLWLFCADTQADSLRNLVSASRDATLTGAPTFTALLGFSGFSGSKYVSMPFSTTGLGSNSTFLFAGKADASLASGTMLLGSGTGANSVSMSTTVTNQNGATFGSSTVPPYTAFYLNGQTWWIIGGGVTGVYNSSAPAGLWGGGGISTSPISCNNANLGTLTAYATMPTATAAQGRKFLSILQTFLDDIGALT